VILGEGPLAALDAAVDGPLYLKVNDAPGSLADNDGAFTVEIAARE
jgi:hypothetical protein